MGYKCIICRAIKQCNTKLFRFPTDDILNSEWLKRCSISKFLVSHRVCNLHFLPTDIKENCLLMPCAVPCLHLGKKLHSDLNNDVNLCTTAIHMKNECLNKSGSLQRSQPSTYSKLNTLSLFTLVKRQNSMDNPRYFNDLSDKHFNTPRRAKRNLAFAKKKYNDIRQKLKILDQRNWRLIKKKKTYEDLIKTLQDTNLLSENASQFKKEK